MAKGRIGRRGQACISASGAGISEAEAVIEGRRGPVLVARTTEPAAQRERRAIPGFSPGARSLCMQALEAFGAREERAPLRFAARNLRGAANMMHLVLYDAAVHQPFEIVVIHTRGIPDARRRARRE
jgi:hypothetical protein